ncbi:MAG: helix-turn-helix transcriptional regulator [Clostridia bacterium]|nr:helix-turn-helix transcriptional regulator [Clostridia bacterium]
MFRKGVTAGRMAKDLGIDYHVIYRAVSGESAISLFVLARVCPYLGVTADWLLGL